MESKRKERKELRAALVAGPGVLRASLDGIHPADLARLLKDFEEDEAWQVFCRLDDEERSEVLQFAKDPLRTSILARMSPGELVRVVEELPADEVVDLLALTDDATSEHVLRNVDFERAQGLRELSSYEADTAGGLMTTEFVAVREGTRVGDAIKEIRSEEGPAGEEEMGVFVVDEDDRPVGYVSDRDLITHGIHTPIQDVMEREIFTASVDDDQEDVAHKIREYSVGAIPVVDERGVLIGAISAEDVRDVLEDEAEEDLLRLVGTSPEEQTRLPVLTRVRHRIPLQALTVVGGLVTAWILDLAIPSGEPGAFSDVLRYLPIIIGLAGNVGIQSSTILVRAFATGEVSREREFSVVRSEVLVGFLIGLLCGGTTTGVAAWMERGPSGPDLLFGAAVGGAIAVAVSWAALLGCLVPIGCRRLGIDPAIVAGPFLITLSDISGAAIFIAITHLVMEAGGAALGG